jgi:hypothetical protein
MCVFLLLFLYTGFNVCYSFRSFYFAICDDFNVFPSYSIVETNYNIMFDMIGILVMSILGGGALTSI